jgi:hypothetical protein
MRLDSGLHTVRHPYTGLGQSKLARLKR